MKKNRFLRSPFIWIVLAFLAIVLIFDAIGNAGGYAQKPTSEVVALINGDTPLTEVVLVDGIWTESFHPDDQSLKSIGNAQRLELCEIFPDLKTEAGRAALEHAWDVLGADHVISVIAPENTQSIRVAERLGETFERTWKLRELEVHIYGVDRPAC